MLVSKFRLVIITDGDDNTLQFAQFFVVSAN